MNFDQRLVKLMGIVIAGNGDLGLSSVHRETNIPLKVVLQRLKESRVCRAQVVFKKGRGRERERERARVSKFEAQSSLRKFTLDRWPTTYRNSSSRCTRSNGDGFLNFTDFSLIGILP